MFGIRPSNYLPFHLNCCYWPFQRKWLQDLIPQNDSLPAAAFTISNGHKKYRRVSQTN